MNCYFVEAEYMGQRGTHQIDAEDDRDAAAKIKEEIESLGLDCHIIKVARIVS